MTFTSLFRRVGACAAFGVVLALAAPLAHADGGTLRVATDPTFAPLEFMKDGKFTGFDVELINALAKTMGKKVEWTDIDFKGLIPGLVAHRFDIAASGIYITEERRKVVDFTQPYYKGGMSVVARKSDASLKTPADLDGKTVAVQVGTKPVSFLKENYPKVHLIEVEKSQQTFDLMNVGRADAVVTGRPTGLEYAKEQPAYHVLDKTLTTEVYGFALRKDEAALTAQMNAALDTLRSNGTYDALVTKWFGDQ
jgi:polar amino acid transport system substrate-binding protein